MGSFATMTAFWALLNAAELLSSHFWVLWALSSLQYVAIVSIPVLWYQFGTQLFRGDDPTSRRWGAWLWVVPGVTALLVWTDPWWGLVRSHLQVVAVGGVQELQKDYGPWFWVHAAYAYLLALWGTVRVIRGLVRQADQGVVQAWVLGGSSLIPLGLNVLHLAGVWPLPSIDPTPLAFAICGSLFMANLARFRFLSVLPAALNGLVEDLDHSVLIFDRHGHLAFLNRSSTEAFGPTADDLGRTLVQLQAIHPALRDLPPFTRAGTEDAVEELTVTGTNRRYEVHLGTIRRRGRAVAFLYLSHDITVRAMAQLTLEAVVADRTAALRASNEQLSDELARRMETENQLVHLSLHDPLTGLPNRSLLLSRLELVLERYRRDHDRLFALLFIDFDNFKLVNDSFGHAVGDGFLREASTRLLACVRAIDTVSRLGGDEFVVLLDGVTSRDEALEVADRIAADLSVPERFGTQTIVPSASIGVLITTEGYGNPEELLRDADMAMYHAKAAGKNRWVEFDSSMRDQVLERTQINNDLRTAILEGQIEVYYQPIVRLSDRNVVGCEALARWNHPTLGVLGPDRFIPVAEESGLIVPLGLLVLREACKTASLVKEHHPGRRFFTAVNVSALQLAHQGFDEVLVSYLDRLELVPQDIHLEITETALVQGAEAVQTLLGNLVAQGFQVKLDDFGTGYSSLSYLHRFPIQTIKIDQSFVRNLGPTDGVVKGIVSLGHELGKSIVAEGIETEDQAQRLSAWGCDQGQGYLFGRPVPRAQWLETARSAVASEVSSSED